MLAAIHSTGQAAYLVGLVLVVACLIGAAVTAYRAAWIACACLIAVALFTAVLLL
jgi:TRAP-type uncharacterized transport system fused permease subunit